MELKVDDGDAIKEGQTLFLIDQDNLKNRVAMAEQALKVVEESHRSAQLDIGIAETQLEKAQKDFERNRMLHEQHSVSDNTFETFEVALDKAKKTYRQYDKYTNCNRCKISPWCRGCPAVAFGYTHNRYAPDPQCWYGLVGQE